MRGSPVDYWGGGGADRTRGRRERVSSCELFWMEMICCWFGLSMTFLL
jgi:hypothetical protein